MPPFAARVSVIRAAAATPVRRRAAGTIARALAKKSKTPTPPRRVQAPRQRTDPRGAGKDRRLLLLVLFSASGVAMLIGVVAFLFLAGGDDENLDQRVTEAMRAAGCTVEHVQPNAYQPPTGMHIPSPETNVTWNTDPPGGGPHFGETSIWGFWEEPVNPTRVVHNLEHGGVALWWGPDVDRATVEELRAFYDEEQNAVIGTPYAKLGNRVGISAWTGDFERYGEDGYVGIAHSATCPRFDEEAFRTFRDAYRGKGPERIPVEANTPGT